MSLNHPFPKFYTKSRQTNLYELPPQHTSYVNVSCSGKPENVLRCSGVHVSSGLHIKQTKRQRRDSNPRGQSPMDFESISLTTRTRCHAGKLGKIDWCFNNPGTRCISTNAWDNFIVVDDEISCSFDITGGRCWAAYWPHANSVCASVYTQYRNLWRIRKKATAKGFEPSRAEPNGFLVHLLNHSDTLSLQEQHSWSH